MKYSEVEDLVIKGYKVKMIKDSVNPVGDRITTWELTYPRFIHSELMTHRLFARNAASSRAIPTKKLIQRVVDNPVMPRWWGKNQRGMQAKQQLDEKEKVHAKRIWLEARDKAVEYAKKLADLGAHKQIVNRIIEPWMFITTIVTATEFENWFALRDHEDAQPEIAWVARNMYGLYLANDPTPLKEGEWHRPYVEVVDEAHPLYVTPEEAAQYDLNKISTARCARVSYLTHDGQRLLEKDLGLHDMLQENGHWSPFEHTAQALNSHQRVGPFFGWKQYRKFFENEHRGLREMT